MGEAFRRPPFPSKLYLSSFPNAVVEINCPRTAPWPSLRLIMKKAHHSTFIHRSRTCIVGLFTIFLLLGQIVGWSADIASIMRIEGVEPGDCKGCHRTQMVQPLKHVDTKGMESSVCAECHKEGYTSLRAKIPLGHIHLLNGISCKECHSNPNGVKALSTDDCLDCHDSREKMAEATSDLDPNPHNSPHYGTSLDCELCHKQHGRSENFCSQCHDWGMQVP